MIFFLILIFVAVFVNSANPYVIELQSIDFDDCVVVDHEAESGDDHGGIAVGPGGDSFIYVGDDDSVRFSINAAGDAIVMTDTTNYVAGLFSDLATGQYYSFTTSGALFDESVRVIDGFTAITDLGVPTGSVVSLSQMLNVTSASGAESIVFADASYVHIFFDDDTQMGNLYSISLADGQVSSMSYTNSSRMTNSYYDCETWAAWGFVERDTSGTMAGVLSCDGPSGEYGLCRYSIGNAVINELSFTEFVFGNNTAVGISDVCSVTISPANSAEGRFYFHTESSSGLNPSDEHAGFCRSTVTNFDSTPASDSGSSAAGLESFFF